MKGKKITHAAKCHFFHAYPQLSMISCLGRQSMIGPVARSSNGVSKLRSYV